jgi:hypothetical protein
MTEKLDGNFFIASFKEFKTTQKINIEKKIRLKDFQIFAIDLNSEYFN